MMEEMLESAHNRQSVSNYLVPMGTQKQIAEILPGLKLTKKQARNVVKSVEILDRCREFGKRLHPQ